MHQSIAFDTTKKGATQLDEQLKAVSKRDLFLIPKNSEGKEVKYFCGNSLGLQPKSAKEYLNTELEDWANLGVEGHFHGKNPWFHYHKFAINQLAKIVGAMEEEVVAMNQLTVNLQLLFASFYNPTSSKYKIIMEAGAFPSDMYAVQTLVERQGRNYADAVIEIEPRSGEHTLRTEDITDIIEKNKDELAMVFFSGVQYYTGQVFDIEAITKAAHSANAIAGFDLAHAVGNIQLQLHTWNVDFAAWCSYKYLNSGPGNVGGIFIHEKHGINTKQKRLAGWWGHKEEVRFLMQKGFIPEKGAAGWQLSNANVLGIAVHRASLDIFNSVEMKDLHYWGFQLQEYSRFMLSEAQNANTELQLKMITPAVAHGCQMSVLTGANGKDIFNYLQKNDCIVDWREPNVIRFAPVPLYNTFTEIFDMIEILIHYKKE